MNTTPPLSAEGEFRKAARSQPDLSCVCVARRDGWVELRDDKTVFGGPDDHRLVFTAECARTLMERVGVLRSGARRSSSGAPWLTPSSWTGCVIGVLVPGSSGASLF
ncbi:hypothetical protein [Saccharopolyspora sp. ASAGF58]|uniref:hypothetical protein n=1 Tax=Saccharopolyspora sp. ASAGF58 TaxID=2719023 RepID=UPI001B313B3E|nr:hypothetical protein [Saccharopolyspora sp. ASAGF58]